MRPLYDRTHTAGDFFCPALLKERRMHNSSFIPQIIGIQRKICYNRAVRGSVKISGCFFQVFLFRKSLQFSVKYAIMHKKRRTILCTGLRQTENDTQSECGSRSFGGSNMKKGGFREQLMSPGR